MKKILVLIILMLFLGCEKEKCYVCVDYAPETLIIRTFVVYGDCDEYDGNIRMQNYLDPKTGKIVELVVTTKCREIK